MTHDPSVPNHPPWEYCPKPPYGLRLVDRNGLTLGLAMTPELGDIGKDLARFWLPPQQGTLLSVVDGNNQLVFGWHTGPLGLISYFGVQRMFDVLSEFISGADLMTMELNARGSMRDLGFSFSKPDKLLNMNDRLHWRPKAERVAAWRKAAWAAALNARRHPSWPREVLPFCLVQIDLPVASTLIRRDPHNWYPTVKPIIDGCCDAAVFLDDSQEYLRTEEPRFHNGTDLVIVRIYPVESS